MDTRTRPNPSGPRWHPRPRNGTTTGADRRVSIYGATTATPGLPSARDASAREAPRPGARPCTRSSPAARGGSMNRASCSLSRAQPSPQQGQVNSASDCLHRRLVPLTRTDHTLSATATMPGDNRSRASTRTAASAAPDRPGTSRYRPQGYPNRVPAAGSKPVFYEARPLRMQIMDQLPTFNRPPPQRKLPSPHTNKELATTRCDKPSNKALLGRPAAERPLIHAHDLDFTEFRSEPQETPHPPRAPVATGQDDGSRPPRTGSRTHRLPVRQVHGSPHVERPPAARSLRQGGVRSVRRRVSPSGLAGWAGCR